MKLDYVLELAAPVDGDRVMDLLRDLMSDPVVEGNGLRSGALHAVVHTSPSRVHVEVAFDEFGINALSYVWLSVDYNCGEQDVRVAERVVSVATLQMLATLGRDAVLHSQGDRILMRRRAGELALYDWWREWELLRAEGALTAPFRITSDDLDRPGQPRDDRPLRPVKHPQVDRPHIADWLAQHEGRVIGVEYARRFANFITATQPWSGLSIDFGVIPSVRLHLDDPDLRAKVQATPLGRHGFVFVLYGPDEPGLICPLEAGLADIDVLSWTSPGELYVCGADVVDGEVVLAMADYAEYDSMNHVQIVVDPPPTS